ncbi:MAG TPA: LEA type 2 family protein [Gemmatimonadaceae bacterium]|nr:LEA type 2 family protein [Gemmatimonadaceae bacterium]
MKRSHVLTVAAMAWLGGVGGCSMLARDAFKQPTVRLARVRVTGIGATAGSLEVELKIYNPNVYSLNGSNFHYRVNVDSVPLAHGLLDHSFSLPRKDSTVIGIPVEFSFTGLDVARRAVWAAGLVNYEVSGDVIVEAPIGHFTIPFKTQGRFSTVPGSR